MLNLASKSPYVEVVESLARVMLSLQWRAGPERAAAAHQVRHVRHGVVPPAGGGGGRGHEDQVPAAHHHGGHGHHDHGTDAAVRGKLTL